MANATVPDLNQLVVLLSKTFEQCLDNSLSDPTTFKEDKNSSDIANLKSAIIDLEQQLKGIRLECMKDKSLSLTESNTLLKRDIDIKQATINKYVGQLDKWMLVLPELQQKSLGVLNAPSTVSGPGTQPEPTTVAMDTEQSDDANTTNINHGSGGDDGDDDDDDDDDDDIEFEEV